MKAKKIQHYKKILKKNLNVKKIKNKIKYHFKVIKYKKNYDLKVLK